MPLRSKAMAGAMVAVTSESAACSHTPMPTSKKRPIMPEARKSWARSAASIGFTGLLEGFAGSARAGAAKRQRPQEFGQAVPKNLNADAKQQEGGEPHHDGGAGGADPFRQARRIAIERIDQQRQQGDGGQRFQEELEQQSRMRGTGPARADGDGHRDGAGTRGQRHGQGIERQPAGRYIDGPGTRRFAAP